jgi:hypothetical protein
MRVLWLIQSYEVHAFDLLAEDLRNYMEVDLVPLTANEQRNMADVLDNLPLGSYDRVMTTLRTKKEMRQWRVMRKVPNLVVFEYDACQNYLPAGKYKGRFSRHYRRLGGPRVIVSGATVAKKLSAEGFDACFLPKGYDSRCIYPRSGLRDIFLGFLGSLDAEVYSGRKEFIERQVKMHGLQILRTAPGEEYARTLSRITIFVSADIGLGEYMAKNFEAMAAGCLLMTFDQGEVENSAVGLQDMVNVVLFQDEKTFNQKLTMLIENKLLVERIAAAGMALAREEFAYDRLGERLANCLKRELLPRSNRLSFVDRLPWG